MQPERTGEGDSRRVPGRANRDCLADSWATVYASRSRAGGPGIVSPGRQSPASLGASEVATGLFDTNTKEAEDTTRLRHEIDSTTAEANVRINQASDAIRTLKDRLGLRQAEHEK